jgi:hypothetical protein
LSVTASPTTTRPAPEPIERSEAFRTLLDNFTRAVSIGLQHGVPLEEYIQAFGRDQISADPADRSAASVLDLVFRELAESYLGRSEGSDRQSAPASRASVTALPSRGTAIVHRGAPAERLPSSQPEPPKPRPRLPRADAFSLESFGFGHKVIEDADADDREVRVSGPRRAGNGRV